MEIRIKAYAYTIDIITEIRYFCKCNNAVFGKFRIIFTYTISKTNCSLHHSFHALFKISGNGKFVRTTTLASIPFPQSPQKHATPSPRTKLASLVKGEVLSPERIRATTGGIATPLSPRPAPTLPNPHYPLPRTITLASLVKGRWIDGKAQTVALLHFCLRYIHLFDLSNFSAVKTEGLLHHSFQNRTIPCPAPPNLPPLSKVRCCRPKEFGRLPEGLPHHYPSLAPTLSNPHYPTRFS